MAKKIVSLFFSVGSNPFPGNSIFHRFGKKWSWQGSGEQPWRPCQWFRWSAQLFLKQKITFLVHVRSERETANSTASPSHQVLNILLVTMSTRMLNVLQEGTWNLGRTTLLQHSLQNNHFDFIWRSISQVFCVFWQFTSTLQHAAEKILH